MSPQRKNPYVGPKPLDINDTLFGRDRELNELIDKLFAERVIVLHSPSGAGKSSLINAGVIPELGELEDDDGGFDDEGSFHVLPVLRVNATLPDAAELPAGVEPNRFALSVMLSVEEHLPAEQRRPLAELAGMRLEQYLDGVRKAGKSRLPDLLIFDQFEEVLTMDSTDLGPKQAFFDELGQALRSRERFVVFAIREDYLAALAPYSRKVPTDLKNTYRLDLLGESGALEAVNGPAKEAGVPFAAAAAQRLVDDLRQVSIMGEDGTTRQTLGPHVEPVQLQVVCHELWRDLPEAAATIELELLRSVGDVNQALAGYYAAEVGLATGRTGVKERLIREWVNNQLITEAGIRGQVLRMDEKSQGLPHAAIDSLVNAHLVRAEPRRGAIWYELTHDRLVGPVREDNEAWRRQHLVPLQIQADIWDQKKRPKDLLLRGEALEEAEAWAAGRDKELNQVEQDFLEQSRYVRDEDQRQEERRESEQRKRDLEQAQALARSQAQAARRLQLGLLAAVLLLAAAVAAAYYGYERSQLAQRQTKLAKQQTSLAKDRQLQVERVKTKIRHQWEQLVVFSAAGLLDAPLTGSLLLTELMDCRNEPHRGLATAIELAQQPVPRAILRGHVGRLSSAQFSPDGQWVLTASNDRTARLWMASGRHEPRVFSGHKRPLTVAAFGPRGRRVLTASTDGTVRLFWRTGKGAPVVLRGAGKAVTRAELSPTGRHVLTVSTDGLRIFAASGEGKPIHRADDLPSDAHFSPDGQLVVMACLDGMARMVRTSDGKQLASMRGHKASLSSARFSPDGKRVVTASYDNTARIWKATGKGKKIKLTGHTRPVTSARFSPDGRYVVTVSEDQTARVFPATGGDGVVLRGHSDVINSARFSPDSKQVITASFDDTARIWQASGKGEPLVLRGHQGRVVDARFSADGKQAITASFDQTASVWSLRAASRFVTTLRGHSDEVLDAAVGPAGRVVTASKDHTARVWSKKGELEAELEGHRGAVVSARFSPDGKLIVTASLDKTARLWKATGGKAQAVMEHDGDVLAANFSPDGKLLVTASLDKTARVWRSSGKGAPITLSGHKRELLSARFSPDNKRVVTASVDGTARVWQLGDGKSTSFKELKGHTDEVVDARFSPDGRQVITASLDRTARIWRADGAGEPVVLRGHSGAVADARFSADGKQVVTASFDKTARVWDATGKGTPVLLSGHKSWVTSAAFSPDGARVVTTSAGDIHIFGADGKGTPVVLGGHRSQVNSARLIPGQRRLVTASDDHTARIWNLAVTWETLLKYLRQRTTVCLDPAKRVRFLAEDPGKAATSYQACENSFSRKGTLGDGTKPPDVLITLQITTPNATIHLDGKPIATNPITVPASGNHHDIKVTAPGYLPWEHEVLADKSKLLTVTLKKRKGGAPRRPAARKKAEPTTTTKQEPVARKPGPAPKPAAAPAPASKGKKPKPPKEPAKKAIYFEDEL